MRFAICRYSVIGENIGDDTYDSPSFYQRDFRLPYARLIVWRPPTMRVWTSWNTVAISLIYLPGPFYVANLERGENWAKKQMQIY